MKYTSILIEISETERNGALGDASAVVFCFHNILQPNLLSIVAYFLFLGTFLLNTVFVCWKLIMGHG